MYEMSVSTASLPWDTTSSEENSFDQNFTANSTSGCIKLDDPKQILYPSAVRESFLLILFTHTITFLFGVAGNMVVLTVMTWDREAHNAATKLFLRSLAVADLLLLLVCAPLETIQYLVIQWDEGGAVCKLASYAGMLSPVASVLNLTAVSLERFIVIVFPMKSRSLCTMSNCRKALLVVWFVSILLTSPVLFTKDTYPMTYCNDIVEVTIYYCNDVSGARGLAFSIYQLLVLFAVPAVLMIACYAWVIKALWISTVNMQVLTQYQKDHSHMYQSHSASTIDSMSAYSPQQPSASPNIPDLIDANRPRTKDAMNARKQVIKMLILVVILFLVCWGPKLIMEVLIKKELKWFSPEVYSLRVAFYLLPFIHSCINPIIYGFMSTKFRRQLVRHCERIFCKRHQRQRRAIHRSGKISTRANSSTFTSSLYSPMTECSQRPTETESLSNI